MSKHGNLKIEQILQFFPDFVQIDEVKEDLVQALITYKKRLAELSRELDESANTTDLIRLDIRALQSRSVVVPILKKCDSCYRSLMTRQFHVFPCHHAFHSDCIITEVPRFNRFSNNDISFSYCSIPSRAHESSIFNLKSTKTQRSRKTWTG